MKAISSEKWVQINSLIYDLYGCNDSKELRETFLEGTSSIIPCEHSFSDLKCAKNGKALWYDPIYRNIPEEMIKKYYSHYFEIDFTGWIVNDQTDLCVYRDTDFISDALRESTTLFKEWMSPLGVYYACGIICVKDCIPFGTVTYGRTKCMGDFTDTELEILTILAKHLCQRFSQLYPSGLQYQQIEKNMSLLRIKYHLTPREEEIAFLLYDNASVGTIAEKLYISVSTVQKHTANVYQKMKVNNRIQLIKQITRIIGPSE